ncbi:hypothetical protein F511_32513 [Dorcoceras hygrometricum]|uniref:DUF4219 domain-containing protein n=1 Tax=Dorcoceras hygrometricum TaxID=472368 RepID=A0A2Z7BJ52_9LAMI|nr:hypothetical protein F511_32513 [Dorcoceras hygrometricum]
MSTSHNKIPLFSREDYDDWKIRMQAHLAALDDEMWVVLTEGPLKIMKPNLAFAISNGEPQFLEKARHEYTRPLKIMKPNLAFAISNGEPQFLEKARHEYTSEDKKKANLDNVSRDILYKTLDKDKNMFSKIKTCATAKDIWEKLTQICEDARLLRQPALEGLTRSARTDSPRQVGRNKFQWHVAAMAAAHKGGGGGL